ncbi:MAG: tetratricopeptide (TPR) repeat protein [Polaribacter sp.]|jgi:tetratricopeptide (TPR) repeat protein
MSNQKIIHDYIDEYRNDKISEADFQKRLQADSDLQQEYTRHKKDMDVINEGAREQLRKKAVLKLEQHEQKERKVFPLKRVLGIAAGFALILSAFFLLQQNNQSVSTADLFASHFELPLSPNKRNANAPSEIWAEAMTAYNNQDFKRTIDLLATTVDQPDFPFTERGKLYLGISYLMSDQGQNAIEQFAKIDKESSYVFNAEWYRALAFLKMDQIEDATSAFQKIADQTRHPKKKEALTILSKLK